MADGWSAPPDFVTGQVVTEAELDLLSQLLTSGVARPLAQTVAPSTAANINFSGIPQTFKHLLVVGQGKITGGAVATNVAIKMQLNGTVTTVYMWTRHQFAAATGTASENVADTGMQVGILPGGTAPSGSFGGSFVVFLPNYSSTTFTKPVLCLSSAHWSTTTGTIAGQVSVGSITSTTSAINQLTFVPATDNFATGSTISVFGLPALT